MYGVEIDVLLSCEGDIAPTEETSKKNKSDPHTKTQTACLGTRADKTGKTDHL